MLCCTCCSSFGCLPSLFWFAGTLHCHHLTCSSPQLCYMLLSCWVYINSRPNIFDLANSAAEKGAELRQLHAMDQHHQQKPQPMGVMVAMRPSRVSYQLTTNGPETLNTTLVTTNNSHEALKPKKPMIVINDDLNRPVPFSSSPSPQPMNGQPAKDDYQRNSSTTSHEAAAALLLASNRHRQSSSYSAKSQR